MPKFDEINSQMKELRNYIDIFKQNINDITKKLNEVIDGFEVYYRINKELINNYNNMKRNYEILNNINEINYSSDIIIDTLIDINNENDIMNKLNKILNIYKVMYNENEMENELIMKYNVNKNDKNITIFGSEFVKNNKYLCKIIYKDEEYELTDNFKIDKTNSNILEIKLKGLNYINDLSYMFYNCSSLLDVININNYSFNNVKKYESDVFWLFDVKRFTNIFTYKYS